MFRWLIHYWESINPRHSLATALAYSRVKFLHELFCISNIMRGGPVLIFSSPRDIETQENTNVELNCAGMSSHDCNKKSIEVMRIAIRANITKSAYFLSFLKCPFEIDFRIRAIHCAKYFRF